MSPSHISRARFSIRAAYVYLRGFTWPRSNYAINASKSMDALVVTLSGELPPHVGCVASYPPHRLDLPSPEDPVRVIRPRRLAGLEIRQAGCGVHRSDIEIAHRGFIVIPRHTHQVGLRFARYVLALRTQDRGQGAVLDLGDGRMRLIGSYGGGRNDVRWGWRWGWIWRIDTVFWVWNPIWNLIARVPYSVSECGSQQRLEHIVLRFCKPDEGPEERISERLKNLIPRIPQT